MKKLYLYEMKRILVSVLIVSIATSAMIFLSMSLFPEISTYMSTLSSFFNTGIMLNIFKAFNLDAAGMTTVMGFYSSYCTVWIVLLGSVYFTFLAAKLVSEDQINGIYEYLLALPISRRRLSITKFLVLMTSIVLYAVIVGTASLIVLSIFGSTAPPILQADVLDQDIRDQVMARAEEAGVLLALDETDFNTFTQTLLFSQLENSYSELLSEGIDVSGIIDLIGEDINDPVALFDKMMANPQYYIQALGLGDISQTEFISGIKEEKANYQVIKSKFLDPDTVITSFYDESPSFFMEAALKKQVTVAFDELLGGILSEREVYAPYRMNAATARIFNMMLTVWLNAVLGFAFTLWIRMKRRGIQWALGGVFVMYFINNLSGMMPRFSYLKYLSSFGYFPAYVNHLTVDIAALCVIIFAFISLYAAMIHFDKADILT